MNKLKITQKKSIIGKTKRQIRTLESLGLGKIGRSNVLVESPQMMGMIKKVEFMLNIEKVK